MSLNPRPFLPGPATPSMWLGPPCRDLLAWCTVTVVCWELRKLAIISLGSRPSNISLNSCLHTQRVESQG